MRKLCQITYTITVAAVLLAPCGALARGPKENAEALDRWLETEVAEGFQGQVILERDGTVVLERAYGLADESKSVPATMETLYYIGSLAKMFTSAVVLQLDAEGKLELTGKLDRYLDGVPPDKAKITIKHLLSHRSGVVGNHPDPFASLDEAAFIEWFLNTPLDHKPGKQHQYSNVGYSVLASLIGRVDGGSFQESVRRRVFQPAGMTDTFFLSEIAQHAERVAIGCGPKLAEHGLDGNPQSFGGSRLRLGPGGIVSTARDLLRWEVALREEKVLTAKQYRLATKPVKRDEPWGLGWRLSRTVRKTPLHFHDGGLPGFNSLFARYPKEDAVIIVLCNRDEAAGRAGRRLSKDFFLD